MTAPRARWRRPELWIPALFLTVSAAWIYGSDALVAAVAGSVERAHALSVYKGMGYILLTAALIHLGIRLALRRERAAARRVEESEALLRAITDGVPDAVYVKDREGRYLFANPATLRVMRRSAGEVLGRTDAELSARRDLAEALAAADRRIMEAAAGEVIEERVADPGGERTYLSTKVPFRDADGRVIGIIGISRDVTDRKRAERELLAAEERVRQAEKLESVGRLAGGVAHEFNNLLTVILGASEGLLEEVRSGVAPSLADLEEIKLAGGRAGELTKQLLAVGRRQVTDPISLDLNEAVRSHERMLRHVLGEGVQLVVELAPGPCPVFCDPAQLDQVILNLALNARDAMPRGGRLLLQTRVCDPAVAPAARDGAPAAGRWVELTVQDDGAGMEPEVIDHLFEPFFTTKPKGRGTGLGLATVYGIVTQAEGHVSVQSAPGQGTTFRIHLPLRPPPEAAAGRGEPAQQAGAQPAPRGRETVLAVEDDPLVRAVTARALRSGGYQVLEAGSGAEALDLVAALREPLHLLVTDVVMPGMDGPALALELQRRRPEVRVLYVSGYPDEALTGREAHGGVQLLAKPFTRGALLARVRAILDA